MVAKKKAVVMPQAKNLTPPNATGVPSKVPKKGGPKTGTGKRVKKVKDVSIGSGKNGLYW